VSRRTRAQRIVSGAAYGGGGAVGLLGGAFGLLLAQTLLARRRVGSPRITPFVVDGCYEPASRGGAGPYRFAMLGDSGAAGLGADEPDDTPAVIVARGLAEETGRAVRLVNLGVVGAQTGDVRTQVERARTAFDGDGPDVVVVMVGANDVTHAVLPQISVRHLTTVVATLVEDGCVVVVACCPDLGTVEPVPQPLRTVGRRLSRTLAAAQALAAVRAGGHAVELGAILGPEFAAMPSEYFSADRFHPSSVGYRRAGEVILPTVLHALGLAGPPQLAPSADPAQPPVQA
jgi:lysophospholipase L1-like esterase